MRLEPETEWYTENKDRSEFMFCRQDSTNVLKNRLTIGKELEQYVRVGLQLIPLAQPTLVTTAVTWSLAWSKFGQKSGQEGGQMVGQIVGQMVNELCTSRRDTSDR